MTALIIGGVLVGVAAIVLVASSVGGGSSSRTTGAASSTGAGAAGTRSSASGPANLRVVVLNGTTTNGLAHLVSGELRQHGYSRAAAANGRPAGANHVTVVEYTSGRRSDAQAVARSVHATQVQPIEGAVVSLAGSADIVVIVGADRASSSGSGGEPSGGSGGESSPGSGSRASGEPSGANGGASSGGAGAAAP